MVFGRYRGVCLTRGRGRECRIHSLEHTHLDPCSLKKLKSTTQLLRGGKREKGIERGMGRRGRML